MIYRFVSMAGSPASHISTGAYGNSSITAFMDEYEEIATLA